MTGAEHDQLRIWGRYDGYYMGGLWIISFIALMNSAMVPQFGLLSEIIVIATPFFVCWRLRRFRDQGRNGYISFRRALFFLAWMLLNSCILFGLVQYFYLADWDDGQLVKILTPIISTPEYEQMLRQLGMTVEQYLNEVASISPVSFASTCFLMNLLLSALMSLLLAAVCARTPKQQTA